MKPALQTPPWLVVLSGYLCCFFGAAIPYVSGIIHLELLFEFGQSDTATAWAGSIFNSLICLAGPIASVLTNAYSCRVCIITGAVLGFVGFGLSSLADNIYVLYITYGLIAGIGQSLIFSGAMVSMGYHFPEAHGIATGLALCGGATGMLCLPPLMQLSLTYYGVYGTFRLISGMFLQCAVFGALLGPNHYELRKKEREKMKKQHEHRKVVKNRLLRMCSSAKHLTTVQFVSFCVSTFCWNVSFNIAFLYFPAYFHDRGVPSGRMSYLISATGIGTICARFLVGFASSDDKIGSHVLYFGSFSLIGLLTVLLPCYHSYVVFFIYMTSFGLYTGGVWVLMSVITVELVEVKRLASAYGVVMWCAGLGQLIVPYIGSLFIDESNIGTRKPNINRISTLSGIFFMTSALLCTLTVIQRRPTDKEISAKDGDSVHTTKHLNDALETEIFIEKEISK